MVLGNLNGDGCESLSGFQVMLLTRKRSSKSSGLNPKATRVMAQQVEAVQEHQSLNGRAHTGRYMKKFDDS